MHHHNSLAESIQHWFSQPSTVDWCEKNYTVTDLIAEFWNTLSSNAMVFYGIFGLLMHAHFGKRFFFLFASFTLVGIGSVLFHGTLLFPFQLLDELPMCYVSLLFYFMDTRSHSSPLLTIYFCICLDGIHFILLPNRKRPQKTIWYLVAHRHYSLRYFHNHRLKYAWTLAILRLPSVLFARSNLHYWKHHSLRQEQRERRSNQDPLVVWVENVYAGHYHVVN